MARRPSARASTRAESPPLTKDDLSTRESLILAQAVFELGPREWHKVVQILQGHSLIQRPDSAFTPESTEAIWRGMMADAGVEFAEADVEKKKNLPSRRLAHVWHQRRMAELKEQILAEEARFKTIASEIVAIKSGAWDDKIKAMLEPKSEAAQEEAPSPAQSANSPSAELEVHDSPTRTPSPAPVEQEADSTRSEPEAEPYQRQSEEPVAQLAQDEEDPADVDTEAADEQPDSNVSPPLADSKSVKSEQLEDAEAPVVDEPDTGANSPERSASAEAPASQPDGAEEDEDEAMREQKETSPDIPLQQATPVPERRVTRQGKRRASEAASELSESLRDRKKQREVSAATEDSDDEEEDAATAKRRAQEAAKKFERVIMMLHADISNHRNGAIFQNPIKPSEAPDYHEIVKRPMDLKTMKARIKSGQISTSTEFQRDIYLMFANSMMYNKPNSDIYAMAEEMMMEAEKKIQEFRQTEVLRGG